jgi:hypothetical protein
MRKLLSIAALIVLLAASMLVLASPVLASASLDGGGGEDKVVTGGTYTLAAGDTLNSLTVLGGSATVEDGAEVKTTVTVYGGHVVIGGEVGEDVAIIGGSARLLSTAEIKGDVVSVGGGYTVEPGAEIRGSEIRGPAGLPEGVSNPWVRVFPFIFTWPSGSFSWNGADIFWLLVRRLAEAVLWTVGLSLLALLVVALWPRPMRNVSAAITSAPAPSLGMGLLTFLVGPILMLVTAITFCLLPISIVIAIVWVAALLFGWLAVGALLGEWLASVFRWNRLHPALTAALGVFLFQIIASIINLIPCLGQIILFVLAMFGLGAVTLTRFGASPYLRAAPGGPAGSAPASPEPPGPAPASALIEDEPLLADEPAPADEPPAAPLSEAEVPRAQYFEVDAMDTVPPKAPSAEVSPAESVPPSEAEAPAVNFEPLEPPSPPRKGTARAAGGKTVVARKTRSTSARTTRKPRG